MTIHDSFADAMQAWQDSAGQPQHYRDADGKLYYIDVTGIPEEVIEPKRDQKQKG